MDYATDLASAWQSCLSAAHVPSGLPVLHQSSRHTID